MYLSQIDDFLFVPNEILSIYEEARTVLDASPKASAVLSRRCLEQVFLAMGYKSPTLVGKTKDAIWEGDPRKSLSISLKMQFGVVRYIGNLAAHPVIDKSSKKPLDVSKEEAEWCLEIIEEVFREYYEKPEYVQNRLYAYEGEIVAQGRSKRLMT